MSSPLDRKAEIERKKAKLQAIRDEKKRLESEKLKKAAAAKPDVVSEQTKADEIGGVLKGVGLDARPSEKSVVRSATLPAGEPQELMSGMAASPLPKKMSLGVSKVTQTNIPPKELVSYSKETQTHVEVVDREARQWDYYASSTRSNTPMSVSLGSPLTSHGSPRFTHINLEWDDEFCQALTYVDLDEDTDSLDVGLDTPPAHILSHKMPIPEAVKPAQTPDDIVSPKQEELPPPVRELSEDEKMRITTSEDFQRFLDRSSRVVERAMSENVDIFVDYSGGDGDDEEIGLSEGEKLKLNRQFFDERWSKHRTITCIDWSVQHPELLVASYNANEEAPNEPDGVALVWNLKYKKATPEYVFHCQSSVMSTCFAKFHPNLVVGGTYSGQIVLWDNRSNKRTPVQRTPLSAAAHTHPVYCVNVVGTQNAHNLISVSTDGKMCSWSLDMLSQPQDSMELQHKQTKTVAVTSFSFLSGDVNNFVVGSEEGAVYTACRHGSKAGISDVFEGHQGPITGINCHTVPGQIDFSQYFLTSSFDWTVKLWNIKENRALHSFEDNNDYVYDARWSPIHPALFATVDGMGRLDLWNLNNDTEVPTASVTVEGNVSLNRCRWHQSGQSLAAGDDMGKIHIYDVGEPLAVPRNDEWSRFVNTLQELKNQQAEQDDDPTSLSLLSSSSPLR